MVCMKGVNLMEIASLFQKKKVVFSLEIFPPKKTSSIDTIYKTLDDLKELQPDFISVTYGAGGMLQIIPHVILPPLY